ncbi:MAG: hypothetical protein DRQ51_10725 [Gammaproteobacteria bacterium]|nr:MAG: hypothetical protein DRQ51_10725 [Gammaproteobacteria bacterium]
MLYRILLYEFLVQDKLLIFVLTFKNSIKNKYYNKFIILLLFFYRWQILKAANVACDRIR